MRVLELGGRCYLQFERLAEEPGLIHAFCTRPLNVSPRAPQSVYNRALMATDLGLAADRLSYCQQIHETNLAIVTARSAGMLPRCDGAVTAEPGTPLMTFSADCPLVLAYDPAARVLGMVHASWRCTVAGATTRLIDLMVTRFACRPADMLTGIGPGAGPCCYEVGEDVYAAAQNLPARDTLFQERNGRRYFDLWTANQQQLRAGGIAAADIEHAALCTICRNDVFYSFRREGAGCGHFGLMAGMRR
jgi:polyphenol oxidase